ncbi:polysaccharide deacetylase family protein [Sulfitobacter donghicola]|uniref:Polysaccharide deacetylase n=1 Tax=Sulfitobacter donghicola DSW-25 = KCTC 12864 = JCM 14565 TaxID=1300350 RepID=A0A073IH82_9RHOB|nr:polysaccharide deacetylase family protein [Sulfitobacter donghicola]KEJ89688.1 polysaccharide deacetylase [Sulfitobacter donghicola DSW-25 = KCTC 12864 = JCM 14565]KIN67221.1 Polysaccharide deacetylase-like protein [Sulfitobacter donghicola DSW-25 = KCTC 12864 = JCM 14565]
MKINWSPLKAELTFWRQAERPLPIWWRDDDAIATTPALSRLTQISETLGMPAYIAVIPAHMTPSLVPALNDAPNLIPVIHGWRHQSHAPKGEKNAEFGHLRPQAESELGLAMDTLEAQFSTQLVKLFVPPWNRFNPDLLPALTLAGYRGLSTYGPRKAQFAAPNLTQINTHIDPIFWRGHRGLADPTELVEGIVTTLRNRREGGSDATEPLGLLTHHLVHTEEVWQFTQEVLQVLLDGGATPADINALL